MKIAVISFPLLDVGGIMTYAEELIKGYKANGAEVEHLYAIPGNNYSCSETEKLYIGGKYKRGEKYPGKVISYHPNNVNDAIEYLDGFEIVNFVHPSPHPNKNTLQGASPIGWLQLYDTKAKIITGFHDAFWAKTNKWCILLAKKINLLVCTQPFFKQITEEYPLFNGKYSYAIQPVTVPDSLPPPAKRKMSGMVAHQWIKWKNHHLIMKSMQDFRGCDMHFYAGGKAYHDLCIEGLVQKYFTYDHVEDKAYRTSKICAEYHGFVFREQLIEAYKNNLFCIDGSTRGYVNYTHWEPMLYGCISMIHEDVLKHEANKDIPKNIFIEYNWDNLVERVKYVIDHPKEMAKIRKAAFEYVKSTMDNKVVTGKFIRECTTSTTIEPTKELWENYWNHLLEAAYSLYPSNVTRINEVFEKELNEFVELADTSTYEQWKKWYEDSKHKLHNPPPTETPHTEVVTSSPVIPNEGNGLILPATTVATIAPSVTATQETEDNRRVSFIIPTGFKAEIVLRQE